MKKILIIEDDPIVANVYSNKLAVEHFQVEVASDGLAGVELTNTYRPDLILLDLMLPQLNGVEVMKLVRAKPEFEKLPIIVFSNTYLSNTIKDAWKAGANKCFSKSSCTPKQIVEAVHSLLNSKPETQPAAVLPADPAQKTTEAPPLKLKMAAADLAPVAVALPDPAKEFNTQFPAVLATLRTLHQTLARTTGDDARAPKLHEMSTQASQLVGSAGVAGLHSVARLSDALQALLYELEQRPKNLNPSTMRTVASAIDFLEIIFKRGKLLDAKKTIAANILVVDDELLSRRAVTHALEKAKLQATDLEDPIAALKLLGENSYDLVILDADMPGMNGFELCAKLRSLPLHKKTPVVFVTSLNDFEARANSTMAGANDFIAKPFMFVELALKALVFVLRTRLEANKYQA